MDVVCVRTASNGGRGGLEQATLLLFRAKVAGAGTLRGEAAGPGRPAGHRGARGGGERAVPARRGDLLAATGARPRADRVLVVSA